MLHYSRDKDLVECRCSLIKSVVTGQAPVTLELTNTPGEKYKRTRSGTRIYHG